eukprot:201498-Rhodomonas_salina.1
MEARLRDAFRAESRGSGGGVGKPGEGSNVDGGVGARGWQNMNKIQNPGYSALIKGFANLKKLKKVWL